MPHAAVSDLGLHCLHMSHKKDARLIWVKHAYVILFLDHLSHWLKVSLL